MRLTCRQVPPLRVHRHVMDLQHLTVEPHLVTRLRDRLRGVELLNLVNRNPLALTLRVAGAAGRLDPHMRYPRGEMPPLRVHREALHRQRLALEPDQVPDLEELPAVRCALRDTRVLPLIERSRPHLMPYGHRRAPAPGQP